MKWLQNISSPCFFCNNSDGNGIPWNKAISRKYSCLLFRTGNVRKLPPQCRRWGRVLGIRFVWANIVVGHPFWEIQKCRLSWLPESVFILHNSCCAAGIQDKATTTDTLCKSQEFWRQLKSDQPKAKTCMRRIFQGFSGSSPQRTMHHHLCLLQWHFTSKNGPHLKAKSTYYSCLMCAITETISMFKWKIYEQSLPWFISAGCKIHASQSNK